jgi:fatty acid desaturase
MSQYTPGVCNIGNGEIRRRQLVAIIGYALALASFVTMISTNAAHGARWGLYLPLLVGSIGFVQARKKFCLAYGFMGTFNFGKLGQISKVQAVDDKKQDRITALTILLQAAVLALALNAILFFLPL